MVVPRPHLPAGPPPGVEGGRRGPGRLAVAMGTGLLLAVVPALSAAAAPTPTPEAAAFADGDYVVTLAQDPMAEYDGSLPGLPRLKSAAGDLDLTQSSAQRYRDLLLQAQTEVADAVGATPRQRYTVALNGFSARLSGAQASKLAASAGVLSVAPDVVRHLATGVEASSPAGGTALAATTTETTTASTTASTTAPSTTAPAPTTADYLGLTGESGVWNQLGGVANAGKGVVVADLDTGLWPEHPSVQGSRLPSKVPADDPYGPYRSGATIRVAKADGGTYTGVCETGQQWSAADCTTKVVGARAFGDGFAATHGGLAEGEFDSARDSDGHGTHTGTTAVGLNGVPASIDGNSYGDVTGIAPAASLAVYKVCWDGADGVAGCQTSDLVAAIDQAVADDVDVINYSIGSGPSTTAADPVEVAFLVAASAGIFVSASAGNSGPTVSTTDHASPWVTTVAAATSVLREGTVVLGDGTKLVGARLEQEPLATTRLVLGSDVAAAGKSSEDAAICLDGTLDPARTRGAVVVCRRAVTARVAKSVEVARAGGVGMVLYNPTRNSLEPDAHSVPTVHLDAAAGGTVVDYVTSHRGATVSFQPGNTSGTATPAPQISAFSSRGPVLVDDGDVLKPDLTAPGSGVVAGYSPVADGARGNLFAPESGTSMSAPHVTGLAALYYGAHPEFTPMMVKSALMTTARNLKASDGRQVRNVFSGGAGFVDPTKMLNPGLVYDSTPVDWLRYLEGSLVPTGTGLGAIDPSDLNQASIAVADVAGSRTVTRSVTATTGGYYHASAAVAGFDVQVTPSVLNLQPGQSGQFRVTFTRTTAALDTWVSGWLTWKGGQELTVRSPLALKPVALTAPAEVAGSGRTGSAQVSFAPGFSGNLDLTTTGLVAGDRETGSIAVGDSVGFPVTIPAGSTFSRFDLTGETGSDLDLYLYAPDGELLDLAATTSSDERLDGWVEPGDYVLVVDGYAPAPGKDAIGFTFTSFVLAPDAAAGSFTATPDPLPVVAGRPATYTLTWRGLDAATPYLGTVTYGDSAARTIVTVG